MPHTLRLQETLTLAGRSVQSTRTVTADGLVEKAPAEIAAAKTGSLTTRTSDTVGTLTMDAGHGITTGARLDLYWDGGSRRGITVGTVAGDSVPLTDSGAGDVLPAQDTEITAMVPVEEELQLDGDAAQAIVLESDRAGTVVLAASNDSEIFGRSVGGPASAARTYVWTPDRDPTNPLAAATVAKAFFSHGDSGAGANMRAAVLFD